MNHHHGHEFARPGGGKARRRGPSSFRMHDPNLVFQALNLAPGERVLDLGCGPGDYSFHAARMVGESGRVIAIDVWDVMIQGIERECRKDGVNNIMAVHADITASLPVYSQSIDLCLLSTVLHILDLEREAELVFREIHRVLKPGGRLAVIECKKEDQPFGPPKHMRISPVQTVGLVVPQGFSIIEVVELGYNYLAQFEKI